MINKSRKAHSPVISSFKSSMYFFALMSEYTWIVIHDHTTIIEAINEMYKCMSLTKSPPPIAINAAMIVIFFWYMQIMVMFVTYSQQSENKRGIALLSCPICRKIRIGSVHDLAKKRHLLDQLLVLMRTRHNEKANRLGAHNKKKTSDS